MVDSEYIRSVAHRPGAKNEATREIPTQKHPILAHAQDDAESAYYDGAAHSNERAPIRRRVPDEIEVSTSGRPDTLTHNTPLPTVEMDSDSEEVETVRHESRRWLQILTEICVLTT